MTRLTAVVVRLFTLWPRLSEFMQSVRRPIDVTDIVQLTRLFVAITDCVGLFSEHLIALTFPGDSRY